ncbi:hypothetical protein [Streptomyces sp. NPDC002790]|uniref:hypothetical protein n=1 Tax=Streptomyces sp. NPDC002790 TaxID=3154431 RepID=UPI003316EA4B
MLPNQDRRRAGPPSATAVYRAVIEVMGDTGPRHVTRVRVAELALTDRQFLRRTWPNADTLSRLSAEVELEHVLNGVGARMGYKGPPDPVCRLAATLPFALGQAPPGDGVQDRIDERARTVAHLCLTGVAECGCGRPDAPVPRPAEADRGTGGATSPPLTGTS